MQRLSDGFAKYFLRNGTVNGWMETDVFADWFDAFDHENKDRPILFCLMDV